MRIRGFLSLLSCLIANGISPAWAGVTAEQIQQLAEQHLASHEQLLYQRYGETVRIESQINGLDSRLNMADCESKPETELKSQSGFGRVSIKVSCDSGANWSLYVPAQIDLYREVVVAEHPLPRNSKIRAAQLGLREMNITRLNGSYFTDINAVIGYEASRQISADRPITASHLQQPLVVKKGDAVFMTASSGSLVVKIPAEALNDGRLGEQIRVRNRQSKRIVDAKITGPGQVEVAM
jgi:flagella basal body P-ring formation protein FlgA